MHPAARGVIRTRAVYQAHVAARLGPYASPGAADGEGDGDTERDRAGRACSPPVAEAA